MSTPTQPQTGADVMAQFIPSSPFVGKLGIVADVLDPDEIRLRLPWDPANVTLADMVHGGAIAALADVAVMAAAWAGAEVPDSLRGVTTSMGRVVAFGVSFDFETDGNGVAQVRLLRQSTDGTASTATEVPHDPNSPAAGVTAHHSFTAEPTAGDVLMHTHVNLQGLPFVYQFPPGQEPVIDDATSSRLGIEVTATDACNAAAWITWAE